MKSHRRKKLEISLETSFIIVNILLMFVLMNENLSYLVLSGARPKSSDNDDIWFVWLSVTQFEKH